MKMLDDIKKESSLKKDGEIEEMVNLIQSPPVTQFSGIDIAKNIIEKGLIKLEKKHLNDPFNVSAYKYPEAYEEAEKLALEGLSDSKLATKRRLLLKGKCVNQSDSCPIIAKYFFDVLEDWGLFVRRKKHSENLYIYNGKYWCEYSKEYFLNTLSRFYNRIGLGDDGFFSRVKTKEELDKTVLGRVRLMKEPISKHLISYINFLNGTYELGINENSSKFREHRQSDGITWILPYDYDPQAKCPLWDGHLELVLKGRKDCIRSLNEFCGLTLFMPKTGRFQIEKALVMLGEGRNGKSVIIEVIRAVLGKENVSNNTIEEIAGREAQQVIVEMEGKKANVSSENNPNPSDFDKIRGVISQEFQRARNLYQKAYLTNDIPLCIFAVNKLINFSSLDANWERLFPIMFEYSFVENKEKKKVSYYNVIINSDLPGIANLWIKSFWDVYQRGKLVESQRSKELKEEWELDMDSFARWIKYEGLEPDKEDGIQISVAQLHHCYATYVNVILKKPSKYVLGDVSFGKKMVKFGFVSRKSSRMYYIVNKEPRDFEHLLKSGDAKFRY